VSRARALELLAPVGMPEYFLPAADVEVSWWTRTLDCGTEADAFLSAMEELRTEYWLPQSVTPVVLSMSVVLVCVFRRISQDERLAMQRQAQAAPMVVDPRRLRTN
jgi:hypothetical protein